MNIRTLLFAANLLLLAGLQAQSDNSLEQFKQYLKQQNTKKKASKNITNNSFMKTTLTKSDAEEAAKLAWEQHLAEAKKRLESSWKKELFVYKEHKMPIFYEIFGEKPKDGYSLYISMHGGGGAPPEVNDEQWENQKRLYQLEEGVYLAPRASTNDWDLWHQSQIDVFFADIVEAAVALGYINLNKVYIIGYSAGGDGVYQLAPRMSDYWAGAGMFAGHPNETSPLGLRNLAFALWVGAEDDAYDRNTVAANFGKKLDDLQEKDPEGYVHQVVIPEGKGHWMDFEETAALTWLANYTRNPLPNKVVWLQDDVLHQRFYWLAVPDGVAKQGDVIVATYSEQRIDIEQLPAHEEVFIYLNDKMMDLDKPIQVYYKNALVGEVTAQRTIDTILETCKARRDNHLIFSAKIHFKQGKIVD